MIKLVRVMDASSILKELYAERESVEEAIVALEVLLASRDQGDRGRQAKWKQEAEQRLKNRRVGVRRLKDGSSDGSP